MNLPLFFWLGETDEFEVAITYDPFRAMFGHADDTNSGRLCHSLI